MKFLPFLMLLSFSGLSFARGVAPGLKNTELKEEIHRSVADHVSLSYLQARVKMFNELYLEKDEKGFFNKDVYCSTKHYRVFSQQIPSEEIPDHTVMNTEHTWPQSRFTKNFSAEVQKTDLHHLFPTFSKINSERGNYPFANVGVQTNRKPLFCNVSKLGNSVGYAQGTYFEPIDEHKGNVARSLFYFSVRYKIAIEPNEEIFLKFWHMVDPVSEEDKKRNEAIFTVQKNRNPFIDSPELVLSISDF